MMRLLNIINFNFLRLMFFTLFLLIFRVAIQIKYGLNVSFKVEVACKDETYEVQQDFLDATYIAKPIHQLVGITRVDKVINIESEVNLCNRYSGLRWWHLIWLYLKCVTIEGGDVEELVLCGLGWIPIIKLGECISSEPVAHIWDRTFT